MEEKKICPLLNKKCIENKCMFYMQLRGMHPQTGQEIDQWGCSVVWMPILLIENSNMQRQTGAAIESTRNNLVQTLIDISRRSLPE